MKIKSKAILLVLSAVLLVAASVFGTLAYLTSEDSVTNTFTVGRVQITLDEAKVGDDGKAVTPEERVKKNSYHLVPGGEYDKDPTVTILKGSDKSYVRAIVTVAFESPLNDTTLAMELDDIVVGNDSTVWNRVNKTVGEDKKVITYEYRYVETEDDIAPAVAADAASDLALPAIFTDIKIPSAWDNEDMAAVGNFEINVVAHAIQAAGFDTADAAWAAFDAQN